jgi:hypothetical protein
MLGFARVAQLNIYHYFLLYGVTNVTMNGSAELSAVFPRHYHANAARQKEAPGISWVLLVCGEWDQCLQFDGSQLVNTVFNLAGIVQQRCNGSGSFFVVGDDVDTVPPV